MSEPERLEGSPTEVDRKIQQVLDEEPVLTIQQSLQGIAVEIAKSNAIALRGQQLQERQTRLFENYLDIVRLSMRQLPGGPGGSSDAFDHIGKAMDALLELATRDATKEPVIRSITGDGKQLPIENESGGTRIAAAPTGNERELDE